MTRWRIVCDAGGTHIRCARSAPSRRLSDLMVVPSASCVSLEDALDQFADTFSDRHDLAGIAIAAAGPVENGEVRLTNCALSVGVAALSSRFDGRSVRVINDLEAAAWALPHLEDDEMGPLVAVEAPLRGPRLVVNVGTGFGAALSVETSGGRYVIGCEPGHMKLASGAVCRPGELAATVSVEAVLSGRALQDTSVLQAIWGGEVRGADVFQDTAFASRFSTLLGQVCGDLVLACGAWGGVFLCGSVAAGWSRHRNTEAFRQAFADKGPMRGRMEQVRVDQILAPYPALIGLSALPLSVPGDA